MYLTQAAFRCDECRLISIGFHVGGQLLTKRDSEPFLDENTRHWLPSRGASTEFPDVPEHVAEAATEATLCLSFGAYRAVGSLARAVVESTAKDKGILTGNLASKIDALEAAGHVRPHTRDQAHEIRHFGNDMAHGDFADPVGKEEAEEAIQLMTEVLDEVYQSPARLAKVKASRLAKKTQGQTSTL